MAAEHENETTETTNNNGPEVIVGSPERDIQVKAIVQLEKVQVKKNEENEEELFKMRAKLFRFHVDEEDGGMWKERGVGEVRILKNTATTSYRVIMRRDQTLKICLNHTILPHMDMQNHKSNEKALLWSTPADFADGEAKAETLCIRFGKVESATSFKTKFDECVKSAENEEKSKKVEGTDANDGDKLADDLSTLAVKEEKDSNDKTTETDKSGEDAEKKT